ncbi:oxidoreductase, partial [Gordonia polyisoprenivorans]
MTESYKTTAPSPRGGFDFHGTGVVIAGGTSGVGLSSARYFADCGATKQV